MKKIFNILILTVFTLFIFTFFSANAKAIQPLDRIDYYEIKIDPRNDATLDMHFKLTWTVLDSDYDGPLEWIKIGIPNYHVDEIVGISKNIDTIKYYAEGGSYIRIDLDKRYLVKEEDIKSKSVNTPFIDIECDGMVMANI